MSLAHEATLEDMPVGEWASPPLRHSATVLSQEAVRTCREEIREAEGAAPGQTSVAATEHVPEKSRRRLVRAVCECVVLCKCSGI